jgi:hypothetical protein
MIGVLFAVGFPVSLQALGNCIEGDCNEGVGTWESPQGHKYIGPWKDGKPDGYGKAVMPNGNVIEGNFVDGLLNEGKETYPNGRQYVGQFKALRYHGHGIDTYPDGRVYTGEFKEGHPDGKGKMTFPDGRVYIGEFTKGRLEGQGEEVRKNGTRYVGGFKNGMPDGRGTLTLADGTVLTGQWKQGRLVSHAEVRKTKGVESDNSANGQAPPVSPAERHENSRIEKD